MDRIPPRWPRDHPVPLPGWRRVGTRRWVHDPTTRWQIGRWEVVNAAARQNTWPDDHKQNAKFARRSDRNGAVDIGTDRSTPAGERERDPRRGRGSREDARPARA